MDHALSRMSMEYGMLQEVTISQKIEKNTLVSRISSLEAENCRLLRLNRQLSRRLKMFERHYFVDNRIPDIPPNKKTVFANGTSSKCVDYLRFRINKLRLVNDMAHCDSTEVIRNPIESTRQSDKSAEEDILTPRIHFAKYAHIGGILSVSYSIEGKRLASCGSDGTIKLWAKFNKLNTKKLLAETNKCSNSLKTMIEFRGHTGPVTTGCFLKRGSLFASGGLDSIVRLWDLPASQVEGVHRERYFSMSQMSTIRGLQVSSFSDGREILLSVTAKGLVCAWKIWARENLETTLCFPETIQLPMSDKIGAVHIVDRCVSKRHLCICHHEGFIRSWDIEKNEDQWSCLLRGAGKINCMAVNALSNIVAIPLRQGTIHFIDTRCQKFAHVSVSPGHAVTAASASTNDGNIFVFSGEGCTVKVWDIRKHSVLHSISVKSPQLHSCDSITSISSYDDQGGLVFGTMGGAIFSS